MNDEDIKKLEVAVCELYSCATIGVNPETGEGDDEYDNCTDNEAKFNFLIGCIQEFAVEYWKDEAHE